MNTERPLTKIKRVSLSYYVQGTELMHRVEPCVLLSLHREANVRPSGHKWPAYTV